LKKLIQTHQSKDESKDAIVIEDGSFTWDANDKEPTLQNINLRIEKGKIFGKSN